MIRENFTSVTGRAAQDRRHRDLRRMNSHLLHTEGKTRDDPDATAHDEQNHVRSTRLEWELLCKSNP